MTPAYLAMGSNLGDRKAILDAAVAALAETSGIVLRAVSSYHETKPVGGPGGQGEFLNASAAIETSLEPLALLNTLKRIEFQGGRVRTVHWGERTLDLDLLLFGRQVIATPDLTVPHPWLGVRRFVLAPLVEIASEVVEPISGLTIREALARLDHRPSYVAILARPDRQRDQILNLVQEALGGEVVLPWGPPPDSSRDRRRWRHFPWQNDWSGIPARLTEALPRDRVDTGRWLISDFWADRVLLDLWYHEADAISGPVVLDDNQISCQAGSFTALGLAGFQSIRDNLLTPTFVAVVLPAATTPTPVFERLWSYCVTDGSTRFCRDWPGDCQASLDQLTRSFRDSLPSRCALIPIVAGTSKTVAAEIVTACQASCLCP